MGYDADPRKLYVSVEDITSFFGLEPSQVNAEWITNRILDAMGRVDYLTNMVWNGRRRKARLWADLVSWKGGYLFGEGIPIPLQHGYVKEITSLKLLIGGDYQEMVGHVPLGRNLGGYWFKDIEGIAYLQMFSLWHGGGEIQIEYVYGRDDLPYNIRRLVELYVLRDVIRFSRTVNVLPEGVGVGLKEALRDINTEIDELESNLKSIRVPHVWEDLGEVIV